MISKVAVSSLPQIRSARPASVEVSVPGLGKLTVEAPNVGGGTKKEVLAFVKSLIASGQLGKTWVVDKQKDGSQVLRHAKANLVPARPPQGTRVNVPGIGELTVNLPGLNKKSKAEVVAFVTGLVARGELGKAWKIEAGADGSQVLRRNRLDAGFSPIHV